MRAGVATREILCRVRHRCQQRFWQPGGQRHAERVAIAAAYSTGMVRASPAILTVIARRATSRTASASAGIDPRACGHFVTGQIAEPEQQSCTASTERACCSGSRFCS